ncbi:MAG: fimbrillin family protein [Bacteroidales bacterium]|nr:fimbrillin family protein [Bacteroidales bacterium]
MKATRNYILLVLMALLLAACSDDTVQGGASGEIPDLTGEAVRFTTSMPASAASRAESANSGLIGGYSPMVNAYELSVKMYKAGEAEPIGECIYTPASTAEGADGTLAPATAALFRWPDNVNDYGFEATAGSTHLQADQTTAEAWLEQDRLHGYAYEPVLDDGGNPVDNIDALNYRKSGQWFEKNRVWMTQTGLIDTDDLRKVPLFLSHKRAWITVRLIAAEGTNREDLDFATAGTKISTEIYSYNAEGNIEAFTGEVPAEAPVRPLAQEWTHDYEADINGPAETRTGVQYHAIVEPHDYLANADSHKICRINVAGQNFSFFAGNDARYTDYKHGVEPAHTAMQAYNLTAGKHLVIDVILSRESRKILITAYLEDWTEMVTTSVCDDFGLNGDPITIQNRQQLIDFLGDPELNKPGNMAIVSAGAMNLDADGDPWSNYSFDLRCTLNMGGCIVSTSSQLLRDIEASGSLVYGDIRLAANSTVPTVVCRENHGSIEYISVTGNRTSKATVAGIAAVNYCNISNCSTTKLTVEGDAGIGGYIGGIAAQSLYEASEVALVPIIFNCSVNGLVRVADGVTGGVFSGGIAGKAEGRISGCCNEYGVPIVDEERSYSGDVKVNVNIVYAESTEPGKTLDAHNNEWPTKTRNDIGTDASRNENVRGGMLYDGIINNQRDLSLLVKDGISPYNIIGSNYRVADDFTVTSDGPDGWELKSDATTHYNVYCNIEGNGKTITTTSTTPMQYGDKRVDTDSVVSAPILFNTVLGKIENLNLYCDKPLYGIPNYSETGKNLYNDGCGSLAYAVNGGVLRNINVWGTEDSFVQAASPGGIVVRAYGGATIENCNCFLPIRLHLGTVSDGTRVYGGGIVAIASKATVTRCAYVPADELKGITHDYTDDKARVFLGGIVGGLRIHDTEVPNLTVTDCSSWFAVQQPELGYVAGKYTKGSIVGTTCFINNLNEESGVDGCEGNWWPVASIGAGYWMTKTEALAIGLKNSVSPMRPSPPELSNRRY